MQLAPAKEEGGRLSAPVRLCLGSEPVEMLWRGQWRSACSSSRLGSGTGSRCRRRRGRDGFRRRCRCRRRRCRRYRWCWCWRWRRRGRACLADHFVPCSRSCPSPSRSPSRRRRRRVHLLLVTPVLASIEHRDAPRPTAHAQDLPLTLYPSPGLFAVPLERNHCLERRRNSGDRLDRRSRT